MGMSNCGQRLLRIAMAADDASSNARELWTVMQQHLLYLWTTFQSSAVICVISLRPTNMNRI